MPPWRSTGQSQLRNFIDDFNPAGHCAIAPYCVQRRAEALPGDWSVRSFEGMTLQTFLIWIVIGLVAGWLASAVVGGGFGLIGDIVVGVVGAFVGGFIFRALHIHAPFAGLAGTIFVAFIGAVVLLLVLRLIRAASLRRP
jgi:uncharacterized membrane protein YeaQ/YmgE (transglycosylase-associated protein family)